MEPFNFDLNPAMSSGIFYHKQDSNDSLDFSENNNYINYEKDQADNFTDNFNQVFNGDSPDNKEDDLFSDTDEYYNKDNVDEFIIYFQKKLSKDYFTKEFDSILTKIENKFPYFFEEKNAELKYMIEKLKFFKLLGENKVAEAIKFYQERLLTLIKEVKKQNWENKSKFFIQLIKRPNLIGKNDQFLKKYYDKFNYELEKAIRIFLHEDNQNNNDNNDNEDNLSSSNNVNILSSSSFEIGTLSKISSNDKNFEKSYKKNSKEKENEDNNEEENKDELDLDNMSTKEEYSDFEDEIQPKMCGENEQGNNNEKIKENDNIINSNIIADNYNNEEMCLDPVNNNGCFLNDSISSFSKSHKNSYDINYNFQNEDENEYIIDTSSKKNYNNIQQNNKINNYDNYNNFEDTKINTNTKSLNNKTNKETKKKGNKKQKSKEQEIIFNQLPFLNSFKPRYIKRETIDKKIIRTFKKYVVKENKEKRLEINGSNMDQNFFISLINGNIMPPIDFYDIGTGEYIKFSSFNCNYLLWFFNKKGVKEIYNQFINEKGKEFINEISQYYQISQEEKNQLNSYIINYPFIFDLSLVNNITQGTAITHLYRTVDKNKVIQNRKKNKENDLDLKRNKSNSSSFDKVRERSRSRDCKHDED